MKKVKAAVIGIIVLVCIAGIAYLSTTYLGNSSWPKRFDAELDQFFGPGNWQQLSSESKQSRMYTRTTTDSTGNSQNIPGSYKNWLIGFTDRHGEEAACQITNHTLKINHDKYWLLSPKRYSSRQALILELMDVALSVVEDEIYNDVLCAALTQREAACLAVTMSYHGGNPEPDFYDALWKEPWFTVNAVTAGDFLACGLHDFYLRIFIYDYRFQQLTAEEQQHVLDSFAPLQDLLLEQYGNNASFELYFSAEQQVEYVDGIRQ